MVICIYPERVEEASLSWPGEMVSFLVGLDGNHQKLGRVRVHTAAEKEGKFNIQKAVVFVSEPRAKQKSGEKE